MAAITLTDLTNYMKDYPSGTIVPENACWDQVPLFEYLKANIDRTAFQGQNIEVLIQAGIGGVAEGFTENQDIPRGGSPSYVKQLIPLREIIANAELTLQVRNRATGGNNSWGNQVDAAIKDMFRQFFYLNEIATLGNGTGAVAVVSATATNNGTTSTYTCGNTYTTLGIENVQLLQPGMKVDFYRSGSAVSGATGLTIASVSFGKRDNGAATTGTFTVTETSAHSIVSGDVVYVANSKDKLPMGLQGISQDGVHYTGVGQVTTFQNLARATYAALRAKIYQATDFGPTSETPSDGTPCSWGLTAISDMIDEAEDTSGKKIGALVCHGDLAKAIDRLNKSTNDISVQVSTARAAAQAVVGARRARTFEKSDGATIPIIVCRTMPRNVLHGVSLDAIKWHPETEFDFMRLYGEIWMPSKDDRKANFEAPYYGAYNLSSERCDCHFTAQDLSTAV